MATRKEPGATKSKGGRPSKYEDSLIEKLKRLCILGATDADIANIFSIDLTTLSRWKVEKPEFREALKVAKAEADSRVERSLFERAMGYEHDEVDIRVINNQIVQTPIRKKYPPDTTAMIFWLKNRNPAQWRDKVDHTLSGPNGEALNLEVTFVRPNRTA